ncbi:hypothetical protein ZWY2020_003088 [Hordeum vulgare]|nr:hypothetical protein ZWY2020_003088 [Hordeum vulgare]
MGSSHRRASRTRGLSFATTPSPRRRAPPEPEASPRPLHPLRPLPRRRPSRPLLQRRCPPEASPPLSGPLLSSSSWALSRSHAVHTTALPIEAPQARAIAGRASFWPTQRWEPKRVYGGEAAGAGGGEKFLNLPNLVSIGCMASGPLIGWERKAVAEVASGSF